MHEAIATLAIDALIKVRLLDRAVKHNTKGTEQDAQGFFGDECFQLRAK